MEAEEEALIKSLAEKREENKGLRRAYSTSVCTNMYEDYVTAMAKAKNEFIRDGMTAFAPSLAERISQRLQIHLVSRPLDKDSRGKPGYGSMRATHHKSAKFSVKS